MTLEELIFMWNYRDYNIFCENFCLFMNPVIVILLSITKPSLKLLSSILQIGILLCGFKLSITLMIKWVSVELTHVLELTLGLSARPYESIFSLI
jgi:hypothetical protein